jgi:hypothetical protein
MCRDGFVDMLADSVSATSFEHIVSPEFRGLLSAGCSCSEMIGSGPESLQERSPAHNVIGRIKVCSRSKLVSSRLNRQVVLEPFSTGLRRCWTGLLTPFAAGRVCERRNANHTE